MPEALALILKLLPSIPSYERILVEIVQSIKDQTGQTDEQICAGSTVTFNETEQKILARLLQLGATPEVK
jgi:hypothetical protein